MRLSIGSPTPPRSFRLDVRDEKILALLANDARIPFSRLGKKVGLSKDAVRYRVRRYEEEGVIKAYLGLVDLSKFGYMTYHLLLQLNKPLEKEEKEVIDKIKEFPFVRAVLKFSGRYDLQVALVARNLAELERHSTLVQETCAQFLEREEPLLITSSLMNRAYPGNLFDLKESTFSATSRQQPCDETDQRLLRRIANDGRATLSALGSAVGLSADAVAYRLKALGQAGYLTRFVAAINYEAIGSQLYLIMFDTRGLSDADTLVVKELLRQQPRIVWCVKALGRFNLLLYLVTDTPGDVHRVVETMRSHFPQRIREHEALLAYEEYKYTYLPDGLAIGPERSQP